MADENLPVARGRSLEVYETESPVSDLERRKAAVKLAQLKGITVCFDENGVTILQGSVAGEVVPERMGVHRDADHMGNYRQFDVPSATYRLPITCTNWRQIFTHDNDPAQYAEGRGASVSRDLLSDVADAVAAILVAPPVDAVGYGTAPQDHQGPRTTFEADSVIRSPGGEPEGR